LNETVFWDVTPCSVVEIYSTFRSNQLPPVLD